jgi:hypothetical protein
MKYLIVIGLLWSLVDCNWRSASSPSQMALISGLRRCQSDVDCNDDDHCGFVAVDTYPVCRPGSHSQNNLAIISK